MTRVHSFFYQPFSSLDIVVKLWGGERPLILIYIILENDCRTYSSPSHKNDGQGKRSGDPKPLSVVFTVIVVMSMCISIGT